MEFVDAVLVAGSKKPVVVPNYHIKTKSGKYASDIMIEKGKLKAVWDPDNSVWSMSPGKAYEIIDREVATLYYDQRESVSGLKPQYINSSISGELSKFNNWMKQCPDISRSLNQNILFSDHEIKLEDYATFKLPYKPEDSDTPAFDELIDTFFDEEFKIRFLWSIGAIFSGASKTLQKMAVIEGEPSTGKSTMLNILQDMLTYIDPETKQKYGYSMPVQLSSLVSKEEKRFALEAFSDTDALVGIDQDGDLSQVESNYIFNQLVSHDSISFDRKGASRKSQSFNMFLIMGTNSGVKITDSSSGIIRRVLIIKTSGRTLKADDYYRLTDRVRYEYGGIVKKCLDIYNYYGYSYFDKDDLSRDIMQYETDTVFNFFMEKVDAILYEEKVNGFIQGSLLYSWYKEYCEDSNERYPKRRRDFYRDAKNYFEKFKPRTKKYNNVFSGFREDKIYGNHGAKLNLTPEAEKKLPDFLYLKKQSSNLDLFLKDCQAQYAKSNGNPIDIWDNVKTTLKDLDTSKLHYVRPGIHLICIDFDIKDEDGKKSLEKNIKAASKWPATYAETSKSGQGLHLYYVYKGDPMQLMRIYDDDIEIKVFSGKSALRRLVTVCNDCDISEISSGLPLKGGRKMVNYEGLKTERALRKRIKDCMAKKHHGATKPEVDFIFSSLEECYDNGVKYDVSDMRNAVLAFAAGSSNNAKYCVKLVGKMKFKSNDISDNFDESSDIYTFFDIEVFPNLFLVCWKYAGEEHPVVRMFNPSAQEVLELLKHKLIGFNCRRYDNHLLWARAQGYSVEQCYKLSQNIINNKIGFFGEAYNVSYTDIYDFSSKKQSLKKWEIELGIHHKELGLPWDMPIEEDKWVLVAEYCDNDVLATEATFNARKADFIAREILADVAGMTVNDTTNSLTTRIIFGRDKNPQSQFNYRYLGDCGEGTPFTRDMDFYYNEVYDLVIGSMANGMDIIDFAEKENWPFTFGKPYFPGYSFKYIPDKHVFESSYRGEIVGEGGYVYSEPGIHYNVALLDIASMHPSSIIAEELFGEEYTKRFREIKDARVMIKHKDFDRAKNMLGGKLAKYLDDPTMAKPLADALKIAINSVYGLTSARFDNPFKDPRNKDNIVAKRGALFMIDLKHAVQERGFTVAHIKTDSIKIPNATPEIIEFVQRFGRIYGYTFEHEATYERMCLVNDAVYIAKYNDGDHEFELSTGEKVMTPWTATGTQFQVPYVFKTLFSGNDIRFEDRCETKSVTSSLYLDMNEGLHDGEHNYLFVGKVGQFCPIKSGCGGGELFREKDGKYYAAVGTKGYRWLESEVVKTLHKEDDIDISYHDRLVSDAIEEINKYGDYYQFVS